MAHRGQRLLLSDHPGLRKWHGERGERHPRRGTLLGRSAQRRLLRRPLPPPAPGVGGAPWPRLYGRGRRFLKDSMVEAMVRTDIRSYYPSVNVERASESFTGMGGDREALELICRHARHWVRSGMAGFANRADFSMCWARSTFNRRTDRCSPTGHVAGICGMPTTSSSSSPTAKRAKTSSRRWRRLPIGSAWPKPQKGATPDQTPDLNQISAQISTGDTRAVFNRC
jgi:hypothetical protein